MSDATIKAISDVAFKYGLPLLMVCGILYSNHVDRRATLRLISDQFNVCAVDVRGSLKELNAKAVAEEGERINALSRLEQITKWLGEMHDRFLTEQVTKKATQP